MTNDTDDIQNAIYEAAVQQGRVQHLLDSIDTTCGCSMPATGKDGYCDSCRAVYAEQRGSGKERVN